MFLGNLLNYRCRSFRSVNKVNILGSGNVLPNVSSNLRKINAIKYLKGGRIRFGSFNAPIQLNSYGRIEGSPGGYGVSPKNSFSK